MLQPLVEAYRLSPTQQRLWGQHGSRIGPQRVCARVSIAGALEPARLREALRAVGARHEILRTTYPRGSGGAEPLQVVQDDMMGCLVHEDLRGEDPARHGDIIDARQLALAVDPIDVERGPVWHARVVTQSSHESTLLLVWPSLVADAVSVGLFVRDLARALDPAGAPGGATGEPVDAPLQHVDVSEWQHQVFEAEGTAAGRQFWRDVPIDLAVNCRLPLRAPRTPDRLFAPGTVDMALPAATIAGIERWARAHDRRPADVFLGAWWLLLWRLTGQHDLCAGLVSPGRAADDLAGIVGPLARTLPVRVTVDPARSFAEWVARVDGARRDATHWHELFAWSLLQDRDTVETVPFCPLVLEMLEEPPAETTDGVRLALTQIRSCLDPFELKLSMAGTEASWQACWSYDPAVHAEEQIDAIAGQFLAVLDAVAASTPATLVDFDVRGARERTQVIGEWNATTVQWPEGTGATLSEWIDRQAEAIPDAVAVWTEDGQWTYARVHAEANQIARRLRRLQVGPETRVGVWLDRGPRLVIALLGILKAGGAYVPLDPRYPAARLAFQLSDASVSAVLTDRQFLTAVPPGPYAIEAIDAPDAAWRHESAARLETSGTADTLAYVIYTSGSTGEPKGAMNTHAGVLNRLAWMQATYALEPSDRVLQKTSINFDVSVWELFWPLGLGAPLVLPRPGGERDPRYLADVIVRSGVTVAHFVPSMLEAFVADGALGSCTGMRLLVSSGEALPGPLAERVRRAWKGRLENLYGPTEAAVDVTWQRCGPVEVETAIVPLGRPIANTRLYVIDGAGRPAPIGVTGELLLGGIQVGRGYWQRPALTAARFVPDAFGATPGARLYRTGDLTRYRADGVVEYVGRADHQVKLRGHRIELGEVEAALRQQPEIREAIVLLREDAPGAPRLVAYLVPAIAGADLERDVLQRRLRTVLPEAWVPGVMVMLPVLPLTPNGKVDRRQLPAPTAERPALAAPHVAPRTATETTLAAIWAEVLRHDRVGVDDNFFALGGDSILSLQIVARAARSGLRLTPGLVFEHQTIAALAVLADRGAPEVYDQSAVTGAVPLTPIQRAFFERSLTRARQYNYAVVFEQTVPVAPERLHEVWLRLQYHHDALRLRFGQTAHGWAQVNADVEASTAPTTIDVSRVEPRRADDIWARIASAANRSLHLADGPLARAVLVRGPESAPTRLLLVVHHLVVDGVSARVLIEDLHDLCTQARVEPDPNRWSLPPKTLSLKAWSERLSARAREGGLNGDLPLWEDMSLPAASVPLDENAGPNDMRSERIWRGALGVEETDLLVHRLPRALGVNVQEALLAALTHTLSEWTGASAWRVDLEGHGRDALDDQDDVSRTVGWLTSVYPVRAEWRGSQDPAGALRAVRGVLRRIPGSGASYGALRFLAPPERGASLRAAPAPEVLFNYWGLIDQVAVSSMVMRPSRAAVGPLRAPAQERGYLFEISASVSEGRLHLQWTYSGNRHRTGTVERLAAGMLQTLASLGTLPENLRATLQTPADFPHVLISDVELQELVLRHGMIAGLYPLSPLQEGLLFHQIAPAGEDIYVQQCHAHLTGPLDPEAFRAAWQSVVSCHDTLRTGFEWQRRGGPLQIVHETATLPWTCEDWRDLPNERQQARLGDYLRDDQRAGFSLDRPPLMRLALLRLDETEWEVVWTSHHLVLDGWSVQLVLRDVFAAYFADRATVGTTPETYRYRDYIAWLHMQDQERTKAFWRRQLDGLRAPSLLGTPHRDAARQAVARRALSATIAAPLADGLRRLGQSERLTMNTWFAGTWALLLAYCTKRDDVVAGAVVSGRPPHLPGIETMAGLFANTLPLRLRVDRDAPALAFFAECQRRQVEIRNYEFASLVRVQAWSSLPAGTPLFDTVFAYENYPAAAFWSEKTDLRVASLETSIPTPYPLTIDVTERHPTVVVEVTFDEQQIGVPLATLVRDGFEAILSRLTATPGCTIDQLLAAADDRANQGWSTTSEQRRASRRDALRGSQNRAGPGAIGATPATTVS